MRFTAPLFSLLLTLGFFQLSQAQSTIFKSALDQDLSFKTIVLAEPEDNVKGIYSKPLQEHLQSLVGKYKQWEMVTSNEKQILSIDEFEDNAAAAKNFIKKTRGDSLLGLKITKGPNGLTMKLDLFLGSDGLLLVQKTITDFTAYEISDLRTKLTRLFTDLTEKIPYQGTILSRKNNLVTINVGTNQNFKDGDEFNIVQIIKINRHPKFNFIVSTEKEILGKIKITKSEETLSFASLVLELNENLVQKGMKLNFISFVNYNELAKTEDGKILNDISNRPDSAVAFGQNPKAWRGENPPSFGKIGLLFGLAQYTATNTLNTVGGISAYQPLAANIAINGELWLNPRWFLDMKLKQYVFSVSNPYPASTPEKLNVSSSLAGLSAGYNFLLTEDFFGPKIKTIIGYSNFRSVIDDSAPTALTSLNFSGLSLGLSGSLPLSSDSPVSIGGQFNYYLSSSMSESPVSSGGSGKATISNFNVFLEYLYSNNVNFLGQVNYDLYNASFSGAGTRPDTATSLSHQITTLAVGAEYLF